MDAMVSGGAALYPYDGAPRIRWAFEGLGAMGMGQTKERKVREAEKPYGRAQEATTLPSHEQQRRE